MSDDAARHWARVDALFAAALLRSPEEREAYLSAACSGDAALERTVRALLQSMGRAEAAIGESADALLEISGPLVEAPDAALPEGTLLGAYVVLRLLGRGGMGNVYAATRADGSVDREVAVKVVRSGISTGAMARRLRQEQRILGGLEHPRIARLYDSGVTPDGAPFLVMELVQGTRIDRHVLDGRLPLRDRLRLFDEVCAAVSFAHQRLVVHRDLKPANVFVASDGHVRLLDFGIARLLADDAGTGEAETRPGQLVLTPEYAAPEQARGQPAGVTMDVYALGVMLHELLTGSRPAWQRLAMSRADDATIERAMVPPSRTVADDPAMARSLRGDLDRVILKALAPREVDRYATVDALREDLRRVRDGYPILARRASPLERTVRLVRRNPLATAAWSLLATVSLAFVTNTLVQGQRLASERDRASAERDRANAAAGVATAQRDRARTTSRVLTTLFERGDPFAPGRGDTLRVTQVLAEGVERVNRELAGQPAARAELLSAIGRAYLGLGRYAEASALLDTARALQASDSTVTAAERTATLSALGNLARLRGRFAEADSLHGQALALQLQPNAERVETPASATTTAVAPIATLSPATEAGDKDRAALAASLANVGSGHMERSRFDSARVYLDSALALLRASAVPDSGKLADVLNNRATLAMRMGDLATATRLSEDAYQMTVARLGADHPRVAAELANLGYLLDRAGRSADAEPKLREALRLMEGRMPATHIGIRTTTSNLGKTLSHLGRFDEAERLIAGVIATERGLGANGRYSLTYTLDDHAGVLERMGREREAQGDYREAYEIRRSLPAGNDPGVAVLRGKVADITCRLDGATPVTLAEFEASLGVLDGAFPPAHPARLGARGHYGACLVRGGRKADGEKELLVTFDAARQASPPVHAVARTAGKELLALYEQLPDANKRAALQLRLDSLEAAQRRR